MTGTDDWRNLVRLDAEVKALDARQNRFEERYLTERREDRDAMDKLTKTVGEIRDAVVSGSFKTIATVGGIGAVSSVGAMWAALKAGLVSLR